MTLKAYEREAFYIPLKQIPKAVRDEVLEDFTFRFYNDKACDDCEWRPERHSDVCDNCNEYKGGAILAKPMKLGEKKYMSFPIGNRPAMIKSLRRHGVLKKSEEPKFINRQPLADDNEFRKPIKFKFKNLHDYQVEALQAMLEGKKGVLKSPPRTGKTVMSTALICTIGGKALIMASQRDWLLGFYETFCGSDTQKPWTNATGSGADTDEQKWWRKSGRPRKRVGFCKTLEDFQRHDVCLVTYQTFINEKGRKLLRKVRDMFTTLVVDECFHPDTLVMTDKGLVPIKEIAADFQKYKALSFNHEKQLWEYRQVTNAFPQPTRKKLLRITLPTGSFTCTEDHRVWSEDRQDYVKARDLRPGESVKQFAPNETPEGAPADLP